MTEESALIATLEGGGLDVRFLSRHAKLRDLKGAKVATCEGPPLAVPKKTKLYVEFAKRERENVVPLYHAFQQCAPLVCVNTFRFEMLFSEISLDRKLFKNCEVSKTPISKGFWDYLLENACHIVGLRYPPNVLSSE
jgi:hypothetical protein